MIVFVRHNGRNTATSNQSNLTKGRIAPARFIKWFVVGKTFHLNGFNTRWFAHRCSILGMRSHWLIGHAKRAEARRQSFAACFGNKDSFNSLISRKFKCRSFNKLLCIAEDKSFPSVHVLRERKRLAVVAQLSITNYNVFLWDSIPQIACQPRFSNSIFTTSQK